MKSPCREALKIVNGARQKAYGPPERNLNDIAKLWSVFLRIQISPWQVAWMMVLLKVARLMNGASKDSMVDVCGYAELAAKLLVKEAVK